jgi:hypothetical protein
MICESIEVSLSYLKKKSKTKKKNAHTAFSHDCLGKYNLMKVAFPCLHRLRAILPQQYKHRSVSN